MERGPRNAGRHPNLDWVLADPPRPDDLRLRFEGLLNLALTQGSWDSSTSGLGPRTLAAIEAVARDHPDADADQITNAYDAFQREHG